MRKETFAMKKNSTGLFMTVSSLMLLLHILRGNNLTFIIGGWIPYALYYGTIGLYVIGLLCRLFRTVKKKEDC